MSTGALRGGRLSYSQKFVPEMWLYLHHHHHFASMRVTTVKDLKRTLLVLTIRRHQEADQLILCDSSVCIGSEVGFVSSAGTRLMRR